MSFSFRFTCFNCSASLPPGLNVCFAFRQKRRGCAIETPCDWDGTEDASKASRSSSRQIPGNGDAKLRRRNGTSLHRRDLEIPDQPTKRNQVSVHSRHQAEVREVKQYVLHENRCSCWLKKQCGSECLLQKPLPLRMFALTLLLRLLVLPFFLLCDT